MKMETFVRKNYGKKAELKETRVEETRVMKNSKREVRFYTITTPEGETVRAIQYSMILEPDVLLRGAIVSEDGAFSVYGTRSPSLIERDLVRTLKDTYLSDEELAPRGG